jgi:hypothetical protein
MKHTLLLAAIIIGLSSCEKDKDVVSKVTPTHPQMFYRDLSARVINMHTPGGIDINGDGPSDVWFENWTAGNDVLGTDTYTLTAAAGENSKLLTDAHDESIIYHHGGVINATGSTGFTWSDEAMFEMVSQTVPRNGGAVTWDGPWKAVDHKFLPVQVTKNSQVYYGWIELSFNTATGALTLYRSGVSTEPDRDVRAGF